MPPRVVGITHAGVQVVGGEQHPVGDNAAPSKTPRIAAWRPSWVQLSRHVGLA
jgi:hypothetical protein